MFHDTASLTKKATFAFNFLKMDPSPFEKLGWIILLCFLILLITHEVLSQCKLISTRIRQRYLQKIIFLWLGMSLGLFQKGIIFKSAVDMPEPPRNNFNRPTIKETWRLMQDGRLVFKSNKTFVAPELQELNEVLPPPPPVIGKRVIFIITTEFTVVQSAVLTRLAQALYPARQFVMWVVVSLPLRTSPGARDRDSDNVTIARYFTRYSNFEEVHAENLNKQLSRFGIPYVLLSPATDKEKFKYLSRRISKIARITEGYQIGLTWTLGNFSDGVVLLANEHYTYNSALFFELQKTKALSCWQLGLVGDMRSELIFRRTKNGEVKVIGHYDKTEEILGSIMLERGGYAFDINFLWKTVSPQDVRRMLRPTRKLINDDLQIVLDDIETIFKNNSNIEDRYGNSFYVWKTLTLIRLWPQKLNMNSKIFNLIREGNGTNIKNLLEKAFGPRYKMLEVDVVDVTKAYKDYYDAAQKFM